LRTPEKAIKSIQKSKQTHSGGHMNVVTAREAVEHKKVPWTMSALYQFSHRKKHPRLVFKVENKLFVDLDEVDRIFEAAQRANEAEAKRVRRGIEE
jgi:hypothetical protein